jgi:hypothetical protein
MATRYRFLNLGVAVISILGTAGLVLALMLAVLASMGCASSKPPRIETVEVMVPVVVPPPPIELPPPPARETLTESEENATQYIRVMVRDLLRAWAHIEELTWLIETHNEATQPD